MKDDFDEEEEEEEGCWKWCVPATCYVFLIVFFVVLLWLYCGK